jgi:hypothetical protein
MQIGNVGAALADFGWMVRPGGNWDLKIYLRSNVHGDVIDNHVAVSGEAPYYAKVNASKQIFLNVWGNIFYGYVGRAAELSTYDLKAGVNALGGIGGGSLANLNNPGNVIERQMGYDLFANHPNSLSSANIDQQIRSKLGDFNYAQSKCDVMPLGDTWKTKNKSVNYTTRNSGSTDNYGW